MISYLFNTMSRFVKVAFLVAQMVKNLPAMQEAWIRSLGQKDPLEEEMTTHSSILAWSIPGTEELAGCHLWVAQSPTQLKRLSSSSNRSTQWTSLVAQMVKNPPAM